MGFGNNKPKSVLEYYVYLFSMKKLRKGKHGRIIRKQNLITEATISWLKLNSKKKQIITTRFQRQQLKLKKNFAEKLRTVVPVSKKIFRQAEVNNSINLLNFSNEDISKYIGNECKDLTKCNTSMTSNSLQLPLYEPEKQENALIEQLPALMLEPTPPAFRTCKDFYNLLNRSTENIIPWDALSRGVKGQYERAATRIRRNYIQSYTSFLETLTPIELFHHYKNVTDV
ncbi:uncharacterized protein LOC123716360 [Pieris brassicae]|uniref:Uncharacterized protein n=1 Tax=Pieris brassicae TaxID=7116 RepID=A0A9P0XDR0_PIEBR|nr:uncharacterized protein LOC123716360 [Pieris brassicae]CAH4031102.1 unnamed protein product [Pieris brassicae]